MRQVAIYGKGELEELLMEFDIREAEDESVVGKTEAAA